MKSTVKRSLAIFCALALFITAFPSQVFATDNNIAEIQSVFLIESPQSIPSRHRAVNRSGCTAIEAFPRLVDGSCLKKE